MFAGKLRGSNEESQGQGSWPVAFIITHLCCHFSVEQCLFFYVLFPVSVAKPFKDLLLVSRLSPLIPVIYSLSYPGLPLSCTLWNWWFTGEVV